MTISIRLDPETEKRIAVLVTKTGRTKSSCLREIIERGIEEMEDYHLAVEILERVEKGEERVYSLEEVKADLGLDD